MDACRPPKLSCDVPWQQQQQQQPQFQRRFQHPHASQVGTAATIRGITFKVSVDSGAKHHGTDAHPILESVQQLQPQLQPPPPPPQQQQQQQQQGIHVTLPPVSTHLGIPEPYKEDHRAFQKRFRRRFPPPPPPPPPPFFPAAVFWQQSYPAAYLY